MSDISTPCTDVEIAEALILASLVGFDNQIIDVIRRLAFERDKIVMLRDRLASEWRELGDKLDQLEDEGEDESLEYDTILGRRGMIYTVQEWMGDK